MADITTTIRNAKPGSMIDIRSPDGQIDAFPIERLWELLDDDALGCGCKYAERDQMKWIKPCEFHLNIGKEITVRGHYTPDTGVIFLMPDGCSGIPPMMPGEPVPEGACVAVFAGD